MVPRSLVSRFRPSAALIVAIVALVVALGSVAYATIPDSGGVIHGCYLKAIGSLRVIDPSAGQHCIAVETPIQWNQTGPQGPSGATGFASPRGDTGATGPAGPAGQGASYGSSTSAGPVPLGAYDPNGGDFTTIASLRVDSGWYAITVTSILGDPSQPFAGPRGNLVECQLQMHHVGGGAEVFDDRSASLGPSGGVAESFTLVGLGQASANGDSIVLTCAAGPNNNAEIRDTRIVAVSLAGGGFA